MDKFILMAANCGKILFKPIFPFKIYGPRNLPNKKCLVVGNHLSGWDPVVYTLWTKKIVSFVYKAEFRKSGFLRWVFDGLECVPVRRGDIDLGATKSILALLNEDKTICLFPEGTRNPNVDCLQEFHTGTALFALKTKSPIRPFYIWEKTKAFRKNYMIIGEEFTLEEFYDRPITKEVLTDATKVVKVKVDELRIRLNKILEKKGVKRRERTKSETEKINAYNQRQKTFAKAQKIEANKTDDGGDNQ